MKSFKTLLCLIVVAVIGMAMTLNVRAAETIKIRVVDELTNADFTYQVEAGQSLNELKEQKFATKLKSVIDNADHKYLTFINVATGKAVDLNQKLYSNITIKAIGAEDKITLTIANTGNSFKNLDAGITINQLKDLSYGGQVKKLINDDTKEFAKFINNKTGAEIGLDEHIYTDTTIRAVYYITVTIDGKDHKVLDTSKLADLYQFAAKKEGYEFVGFVDKDGKAATDASVVDKAVLTSTYKKVNNPNTIDNILGYGCLVIVGATAMIMAIKAFKKVN